MMNFDRDRLRAIVDQIEQAQAQIDELKDEQKTFYDSAKAAGVNTRVLRQVIAQRRKDPEKLRDEAELFDLYASSLQGDLFAPRDDNVTKLEARG